MRQMQQEWFELLEKAITSLTEGVHINFSEMTPSKIPDVGGVYLISVCNHSGEEPYYVGRSKNLRNRIYRNQLMGQKSNARLKNYLANSGEVRSFEEAKNFIRNNCRVRWFQEDEFKIRGAIEGYVTGIVFPKYGIYEEH